MGDSVGGGPARTNGISCETTPRLLLLFPDARQPKGVRQAVRVPRRLVLAHAQHPRETHRDPRLVPRRALDAFEPQFEDQLRLHRAHGAEALERVLADEGVDLADLLVGESGVRLGEGHELLALPEAEGVVGEEARALARSLLRVDEHRVERVRLDLPLPPRALGATHAVGRVAALEHEALGALFPGPGP